jgi:hypothetical protein
MLLESSLTHFMGLEFVRDHTSFVALSIRMVAKVM